MSFNHFLTPLCLASVLMAVAPQPAEANRLKLEQSPYLLQHADNPVDWFPWSDEAFALAKKHQRLIFLSIGYSTCHWCHVMEHESFEDDEVAQLLNRDFVSIKVDREERPDIDQFYMQVATKLTGQGGWPLTIIMTPDKEPLFAATYLPKEGRYNRPGMLDLLPQIAAAWVDHPQKLSQDAQEFLAGLGPRNDSRHFTPELISAAAERMKADFDAEHGGFGAAPKFPRPHQLNFLLQRHQVDADPQLLQMVETTLIAMRNGGIYDQIGFGFHRYSTDRFWLVPHFEKMLYDQAGLAETYLSAFQLTGNPVYAETAAEIFSYLLQRMRNPQGGFHSAEDADTQGVEGSTYLWQKSELLEILGKKRGERLAQFFNVKAGGNFTAEVPGEAAQGNILHRSKSLSDWAKSFGLTTAALSKEIETARRKLMTARERRPQPFRDDKVIAAWNGMVISALSQGAIVLKDDSLQQAAEETADFILSRMRTSEGRLLRRWRNGQAAINAFAEDYAYVARGLLDLYHSSLDPLRLEQALNLAETLFAEFAADGTVYTSADLKDLPQRTSERYDGAMPSTPSIALEVAARLAQLTGEPKWKARAEQLLDGATNEVKRYPQGFSHLLAAAELVSGKSRELVIVGRSQAPDTRQLLEIARSTYQPLMSLLFVAAEKQAQLTKLAPFTQGMRMVNGQASAYLCENQSCGKPLTTAAELSARLKPRR